MDIFLAILTVTAVALITSGKFAYRLRRSRILVVLLSGGWFSLLTGVVIGPNLIPILGLTDRETFLVSPTALLESTPLLLIGLGWIGVMVGLQLRWDTIRSLSSEVWKVIGIDALLSMLLFGTVAFAGLFYWTSAESVADIWRAALLLTAGAIGWSMETRSLRMASTSDTDDRLDTLIRATGALGAILLVTIFGIGFKFASRNQDGLFDFDATGAIGRAAITFLLAALVGVLGRYAIGLAGKDRGHQLVVFLGIVVFVAGVATQLDLPPVFAAMLTGIVLVNLRGPQLENFEKFIFKAEFTVANMFALLAGILLDPRIGFFGLAIAATIATLRIFAKPFYARRIIRLVHNDANGGALPFRSSLYLGTARQSPILLALAVGMVLLEPSDFNKRLLAIVVLSGLLSELLPILAGYLRGPRRSPMPGSPRPETETPGYTPPEVIGSDRQ
jgi:hypothetical protein